MDNLLELSMDKIKQIRERGFTYIHIHGRTIKITSKDLVFKKYEVDQYLESLENKGA